MKLYELVPDFSSPDRTIFMGPNGWKVHLSLLRKGIPFEIVEVTWLQLSTEITAKRGGKKATSPAIELEDGTIICDSYRIAEYLEEQYPDRPSLFTGTSDQFATDADRENATRLGKAYSRLIDTGLGNSDPQWAVWYDIIFPHIVNRIPEGPNKDYFTSEARLGAGVFKKQMERPQKEDLVTLAKANVAPIIATLKERPGEFLQGKEPGFVDFVVFGRYAMCRNNNKELCTSIFEDEGVEIREWIQGIIRTFPSIEKHLR
ncbi:hypothetical protein BJ742DRAFT_814322 [Cladochytrium replicatum]|nr:hypothetical protein BJ742DRAFT_814322 [Cladochytrium replicatum]